jgi:hypothetical protein
MFGADEIGQTPHGERRFEEIIELSGTVKRGGIIDYGTVDMLAVGVYADDVSVLAFSPTHRRFIPHIQRFLRRDLARPETLTEVVGDDIFITIVPPGQVLIFLLGKLPLLVYGFGVASISFDKQAALGFLRILRIPRPLRDGLKYAFAFPYMERLDPC